MLRQDRLAAAPRRRATDRQVRLRLECLEIRATPSRTITVDDDGAQTNNKADFTSIQAAVNAASPGDRIRVFNGTYAEQVIIPADKDNITLTSATGKGGPGSNVVIAPTAFTDPSEAVIRVAGATGVEISGFTITGAAVGSGAGVGANYGVLVDGGGSATVRDNRISAIRDNPITGEQEGIGIQYGFTSAGQVLSSGSGEARGNVIDDYQKGGIVVIGGGSFASIRMNTITGVGPTDVIAQNGIQVSNSATADVRMNTVTGNVYTPATFVAVGILIFETSGVTVRQNVVSGNDEGILLYFADDSTVELNTATGNTQNGIALFESDDNTVSLNKASNNAKDGINIDTSRNNVVFNNFTFDNARYGIALEIGATGNTVRINHLGGNGLDDLFVADPAANSIGKNIFS